MKKHIQAICMIVFFALLFPLISSAQNFNFDTTNATFLSVSTDTTRKIVTIIMKTKNTPEKRILECKNSTTAYSFSATNASVYVYDGKGSHPSSNINIPDLKSAVKKIKSLEINLLIFSLRKNQYRIEIEEAVEFDRSMGWLMDDKKTLGFKMESLELK